VEEAGRRTADTATDLHEAPRSSPAGLVSAPSN
jgi:hypothetical protein